MKNKNLIIGVIVAILLLLVGGFFFLSKKSTQKTADTTTTQEQVLAMKPEDIGLEIQARTDKKAVRFVANKLDGVKNLSWEFFYDADIPVAERAEGADEGKVTQSFVGETELNGDSSYTSEYRELGTCSSGRCRYDTGVESVKLLLKVTKEDGKVYQVEDELTL